METIRDLLFVMVLSLLTVRCSSTDKIPLVENIPYDRYPEVIDKKPDLPSPFRMEDGSEYVIAVTKDGKYGIIPVTLSNDRGICKQLIIDTLDFPQLVKSGLRNNRSSICSNPEYIVRNWTMKVRI